FSGNAAIVKRKTRNCNSNDGRDPRRKSRLPSQQRSMRYAEPAGGRCRRRHELFSDHGSGTILGMSAFITTGERSKRRDRSKLKPLRSDAMWYSGQENIAPRLEAAGSC